MRRTTAAKLAGVQLCGGELPPSLLVRPGETCRRFAGHKGDCSREFDRRPLSALEKAERKWAAAAATAERRARRTAHLEGLVAGHQRKIARMEGTLGYRVHFRIVGAAWRLRRYYRLARKLVR